MYINQRMKFARHSTRNIMQTIIACSTVTLFVPMGHAEDSGWYLGGHVGRAHANLDELQISRNVLDNTLTIDSINTDATKTAYKLYAGYDFNSHFAMEAGYFDLDEFEFDTYTVPAGTLHGSTDVNGINLDVVGTLPLAGRLAAYARAGATYGPVKTSLSSAGAVNVNGEQDDKDSQYHFGLGLQYHITEALAARLEVDRYRIGKAFGEEPDVDFYSVGLVYRFGRYKEAVASTEPTRTAPAPANDKDCHILDIQYEINLDDIQREEKEKLRVVGDFLRKHNETQATIEGHTDNVGSNEANQLLSERRAQGVASYLTEHQHINASRLATVGYGETKPIADNNTEEGKRANRRVDTIVKCASNVADLQILPARTTMAMLIEFDRNQVAVKEQYRNDLAKVADFLRVNPNVTATVEGHAADANKGSAQRISQKRAQNVVNYLVTQFGIDRSRLNTEGFGNGRRVAYNSSPEGQQKNNRVNIILDYKEPAL